MVTPLSGLVVAASEQNPTSVASSGGPDVVETSCGEPTHEADVAANEASSAADDLARAQGAVAAVTDPEMPYLTLEDLGVLRAVRLETAAALAAAPSQAVVVVELSPTYLGCPAMAEMKADIVATLGNAGFARVDIRTVLDPPWSSDWITSAGRAKLAVAGIAPPAPAGGRTQTVALGMPVRRAPAQNDRPLCPRCDSHETELLSTFSGTACKALYRCSTCREPFEQIKAV